MANKGKDGFVDAVVSSRQDRQHAREVCPLMFVSPLMLQTCP